MTVKPLRERIEDQAREQIHKAEKNAAMAELLRDLKYIECKDGSILDMHGLQLHVAYHLVRCGWRTNPDKRMIKPRIVTAQGVAAGAVEWVPIDAPDDPLANLKNMTMDEINALPPNLKAQALRRMGGPETPDLPKNPGWHIKPHITIEDETEEQF